MQRERYKWIMSMRLNIEPVYDSEGGEVDGILISNKISIAGHFLKIFFCLNFQKGVRNAEVGASALETRTREGYKRRLRY